MDDLKVDNAYPLEGKLIEKHPLRDVAGANFERGVIDIRWSVGGNMAWVPSKSYFRIGLRITGKAGGVPGITENLAFSENPCGNLFQGAIFRAGDQNVSSCTTHFPQCNGLTNRVLRSKANNDSVKDVFNTDPDLVNRIAKVTDNSSNFFKSDNRHLLYSPAILEQNRDTVQLEYNEAKKELKVSDVTVANFDDFDVFHDRIYDATTGFYYDVKSKSTNASVVLHGTNLPDADIKPVANRFYFAKYVNDPENGRNEIFSIWQPPLGIFQNSEFMPNGSYSLQLNPEVSYKRAIVQSIRKNMGQGEYDVEVTSLLFYVWVQQIPAPIPSPLRLELQECDIQSRKLVTNTTLDFTVPSSTKCISIFIQAGQAGRDPYVPPNLFKTYGEGLDLTLQSLQVVYANQIKPSSNWSSDYSNTVDKLHQRFYDCMSELGVIQSEGGPESYLEYLTRGPFYHYRFDRPSDDRSTQLQLTVDYAQTEPDARIFVCSHYTKGVEISFEHGSITNVNSLVV